MNYRSHKLTWTESDLQAFNEIKNRVANSVLYLSAPEDKLYSEKRSFEAGQSRSFALKNYRNCKEDLDKKAFVVVWSIQKIRNFLLNQRFIVSSDHKPLKYFFENNSVSAKVHRLVINVSDFDFEISCLKGVSNDAADPLSRKGSLANVDENLNITLQKNDILREQKNDCNFRNSSNPF